MMTRPIRTVEEQARSITSKLFADYAREYVDRVPETVARAAHRMEETLQAVRTQAIKDFREGRVRK